eukprot:TRINITY_DN9933_c0_g1_i1.p1 TRINITY_DN9933_c0_g1~~TRINITY_DN9933_c0_g1_i1.p1  ORF type:complete len:423 (+),score=52.14 TRINITY_DN9933_c0_g1_i1:290-1558(+)
MILELSGFKLQSVCKDIRNSEEKIQLLIYFLKRCNCPLLIYSKEDVFLQVDSPRYLLLMLGWLCNYVELFDKYDQVYVERLFDVSEPGGSNEGMESLLKENQTKDNEDKTAHTTIVRESCLILWAFIHRQNPGSGPSLLLGLYRKFENLCQENERLLERKQKLTQKFEDQLKSKNLNMSMEAFLQLNDPVKLNALILGLKQKSESIEIEIKGLKHRELFWTWMESIVDMDKKDFQNHRDYDIGVFSDETLRDDPPKIEVDSDYIENLFKGYKRIKSRYDEIKEKMKLFYERWGSISATLTSPELAKSKHLAEFKSKMPVLVKSLESKYPPVESMSKMIEGYNFEQFETDIYLNEVSNSLKGLLPNSARSNIEETLSESELENLLKRLQTETKELEDTIKADMKEFRNEINDQIRILTPGSEL